MDVLAEGIYKDMRRRYLLSKTYRASMDKFFSRTDLFVARQTIDTTQKKSIATGKRSKFKKHTVGIIQPLLPALVENIYDSVRSPENHLQKISCKNLPYGENDIAGNGKSPDEEGLYFVLYAISLVNPSVDKPRFPENSDLIPTRKRIYQRGRY